MDKPDQMIDRLLRLVEHPEQFSTDETDELLADPEIRDTYHMLCMTKSSMIASNDSPDVEAEWRQFEKRHKKRPLIFAWTHNRAAAIAVCVLTSLAAVAIGIAVSTSVADRNTDPEPAAVIESQPATHANTTETVPAVADTVTCVADTILFENEPLSTIMSVISDRYGVQVKYTDPATAELRLFYRLNTSLSLDDIVARLNTFEHINITIKDDVLTVD